MAINCSGPICYCKGYKYQLQQTAWVMTNIKGVTALVPGFITLDPDGKLTIFRGYALDGPSGPAVDSADNMRASVYHDALYQLGRNGLDIKYKSVADRLYFDTCLADGMSVERAEIEYQAIKRFADNAWKGKDRELIYVGAK